MPWTANDADKHKKGLTSAQKSKWAATANAVLKECQSKGEKDCEGKAIRIANSKFSESFSKERVPLQACTFNIDKDTIEFKQLPDSDEPQLDMVCYSGKLIKDHWYWGDLAIDVQGMKFRKKSFPILEDHRYRIGFMPKPIVTDDFRLVADPRAKFLDNVKANEFVKDAKQGFPFETSISARPTRIQRLMKDEEAQVNGFTMKGPGTIWREADFKEVSVCIFGWDRNSSTKVFAEDEKREFEVDVVSVTEVGEDTNTPKTTTTLSAGGGQEMPMTLEELKKEHPDLVQQIVQETETELQDKFAQEKKELETTFSKEMNSMNERVQKVEERNLQLEKSEAIRAASERQAVANSIWAQKLSQSSIPADLQDKVQAQVQFSKFVKDDVLDQEAFAEAIDKEIKDWEEKLGKFSKSNVLGFSPKGKSDTHTDVPAGEWDLTEDDEVRIKRNLKLASVKVEETA